ncbi:MAG: glycosyltransferase family 2 protein [Aphanocapsa lilacina HA4352-LM1]|jgi:GT2 family glycosyltransferase|nr:glycosyltransferase family 2 protein [Aphanocapsa lilacina HA4352-LM1]
MSKAWKSVKFLNCGEVDVSPPLLDKIEMTFVIVSYNSSSTLEKSIRACLKAVRTNHYRSSRIVVYDNASLDNSPDIINQYANEHPNVVLGILDNQNIGFGRANNRVVQLLCSKSYLLVNPDVTFEPAVVTRLRETLELHPNIAIACPKLLYLDHTLQPSVRRFPTFTYFVLLNLFGSRFQEKLYPFGYYYEEIGFADQPFEVDWGIGAMMLLSGDYVRKFGLFDERYFLYFEDVSLCLHARENGFRVIFDPKAIAFHEYQRASSKSRFSYLRLQHMISAFKFFLNHRQLLY